MTKLFHHSLANCLSSDDSIRSGKKEPEKEPLSLPKNIKCRKGVSSKFEIKS